MTQVEQLAADEEATEDLDRGTGTLPASMIHDVVKKNMWQVTDCYTRHAYRGQAGRLVIELEIDVDGSVKLAKRNESNLGNSTLEGCVLQAVRRMKFPQPKGGTVVTTYPFVFQ
jgi:TonB family protein